MRDEEPEGELGWKVTGWKALPEGATRQILTVESVLEGFDETPSKDAEAPDPGDGFWIGRFFPNDCSASSNAFPWREEGKPFAMRVRHLPSRRTLLMVEAAVGDASKDLMQAWRDLWRTGDDVDAFDAARKVGFEVNAIESEAQHRRTAARALEARSQADAATKALECPDLALPNPQPVRDAALHAMEDASVHLALAASGLPFVLHIDMPEGAPRRYMGSGGRLWRLMPESDEFKGVDASLRQAYGGPQPYWTSKAFRDRAGRGIAVARGPDWMRVVLADMARQGHARAFVKACASKSGTWTVDLTNCRDGGDALACLARALGPAIADVFAHQVMMIQGHVPFLREHRFLVVGHRVVASTASVRSLSVLDANPDRIVHPHAARLAVPASEEGAYDRGESTLSDDRSLVARMARGARDLARALSREDGVPELYCIDMGETGDGRVLPIELNGLASCGLYAASWRRVASALARRHERQNRQDRPDTPPEPTVRHLETRQYVVKVLETEAEQVSDVAERFARWASTHPETPRRMGFLAVHAEEIRAYIQASFPGQSRKAVREAMVRFDPFRHPEWNQRYWEWLLGMGHDRASGAIAEVDEWLESARGSLRLWKGVHGSSWVAMEAGHDAYVSRKLAIHRPGPEDDIVDGDEDGILIEFEADKASVDRWRTVTNLACSWDKELIEVCLRVRTNLKVASAWDHATGGALGQDRSLEATVT